MNNKLNIFIKSFLVIFILNILISNVYAAINEEYGDQEVSLDADLEKKVEQSIVLDYMGSFIYAIGNLAESVTSGIIGVFTEGNVFPWADRVIFNTLPILDINFINPDDKSLLSTTNKTTNDNSLSTTNKTTNDNSSTSYGTSIGDIVRNVYFTGLSLALGFLGVIVAVMAIKLAISTIASEKAKYKEAIVKWITALILLFGMHYALSFIFYLNEQLVVVASKILTNNVKTAGATLQDKLSSLTKNNKDAVIENFIKDVKADVNWNEMWTAVGIGNGPEAIAEAERVLKENSDITYALLLNATIRENMLSTISGNSEGQSGWSNFWNDLGDAFAGMVGVPSGPQRDLIALKEAVLSISPGGSKYKEEKDSKDEIIEKINQLNANINNLKGEENEEERASKEVEKVLYTFAVDIYNGDDPGNSKENATILKELGEYFKTAAWYTDVDEGDWSPSRASIVGAILYTMFVFQSIMFFIAYVKRFFFVIILSIIAPFVIIYDFFKSSIAI